MPVVVSRLEQLQEAEDLLEEKLSEVGNDRNFWSNGDLAEVTNLEVLVEKLRRDM